MTALASPPVLATPPLLRPYTDEEWRRLADDGVSEEFVDGRAVEQTMSTEAAWAAARLSYHTLAI